MYHGAKKKRRVTLTRHANRERKTRDVVTRLRYAAISGWRCTVERSLVIAQQSIDYAHQKLRDLHKSLPIDSATMSVVSSCHQPTIDQ